MTTHALTKISYSNAYSSVLSTGAVGVSHPAHGWIAIVQAASSRFMKAVRARAAARRAAQAERAAAEGSLHTMRMAMRLRASQPSLSNELMAIASRDF